MININLDKTYNLDSVIIEQALSVAEFVSPQTDGYNVLMRIVISPHPDPLLRNVYNLAMGPPLGAETINDSIRLRHRDSSRVFSTAILFALTFLIEFPETLIGLDGSDDLRAILYHSMFITNKRVMEEYFITIGVDWYVKLLRNKKDIERDYKGNPFFKPRPEAFDYTRNRHDLYRYYMFQLKD